MRLRRLAFPALALLASCASTPRIVSPATDSEVTYEQLVDRLADADVVFFGEEHDNAAVHRAHWRIFRQLYERRPDLILSLEMFERDVQADLWHYLFGDIDEDAFLASARPWSNYQTDYRHLVEFARSHRLEVVAANAPKSDCEKLRETGEVPKSVFVAKETSAPEDEYWVAFKVAMAGHSGVADDAAMRRYYQAQCLRDDTMAESIADAVRSARQKGRDPLVVHFCGKMHSDHRLGTVRRLEQRMPGLDIKVLSVEGVAADFDHTVVAAASLADYVLLVDRKPEAKPAAPAPTRVAAPVAAAPESKSTKPAAAAPVADEPPAERPGLGFKPAYDAEVQGCVVEEVIPGGAADKAGIGAEDVIIKLGDADVFDVRSYAEALGELKVGQKIEVTIRRGATTMKLPVVVGRSMR